MVWWPSGFVGSKSKATTQGYKRPLTLKVAGGHIRPGRIPIPELVTICQQIQSGINRQAEALRGSRRTQRPGPATDKVRVECTLELVGIRAGSPTAAIGFELAKAQPNLPEMSALGYEAIALVGDAIQMVRDGRASEVDPGVLDSLNGLGDVIDRGAVRDIEYIAPGSRKVHRPGRRVLFDRVARKRIADYLRPPIDKAYEVEGVVEMADFKAADLKCRILPVFGPAILCVFDEALANDVQRVLRRTAKIAGTAKVSARTGKVEEVTVLSVTPIESLALGASNFVKGLSLDQLADLQGVEPLADPRVLAGGWPEDDDLDQFLLEVYANRE